MPNLEASPERIVAPEVDEEEISLDICLRPQELKDFVGQEPIKKNLDIAIQAATKRSEALEHVLLYGNPGLGKTTLAHIIGREMNANVKITSGPALEKVGDLAAVLSNLQDKEILFIDEIHRLNKTIEEVLYPAMEDYSLDIIIGSGPSAKTIRMPLARFTLIGATTKMSLLSGPLRDRFGHTFHLNFYEKEDIETILRRNGRLLNVELGDEATALIATRARRTPRIANRLLKRVRDFAEVKNNGIITPDTALESLGLLAIDECGLDDIDRRLLKTLIDKFNGGPAGVNALAAALAEEPATVSEVHEPFLLQLGLIERTQRGRVATVAAYKHLNKTPPSDLNERLL